jgi:hypothetical protein
MTGESIATSAGTTVRIEQDPHGERVVMLENKSAPPRMRRTVAGRVVEGMGFQPVPFAAWALRPEALRAIADLLEAAEEEPHA